MTGKTNKELFEALDIDEIKDWAGNTVFSNGDKNDERLHMVTEEMNREINSDENSLSHPKRVRGKDAADPLRGYLLKQSKDELINLLEDMAFRVPEVKDYLTYRLEVAGGSIRKIVERLKKDIRKLSAETGWQDHWRNEGHTPDYSRVRERLLQLLQQGYADDVVDIGKELLALGNQQVEESDDEGETADEIASCMDIVFLALGASPQPVDGRLLWAIDAALTDEYGLCNGAEAFFQQTFAAADWSMVADSLSKRLAEYRPARGGTAFLMHDERDRLTDWIIRALHMAGRTDEVISLCEQEAKKTASYVRLVNYLIEAGRQEDAERWIREGIAKTAQQWPGVAAQLRNLLRKMKEQKGDWLFVAALLAEDFFWKPSHASFEELLKAARKCGFANEIKTVIMSYLETGQLPKQEMWPLPETGMEKKSDRTVRQKEFPMCGILIDVAIAEKKPDDVLRWYDHNKGRKNKYSSSSREEAVAEAIAASYPERAITIWKGLAENLISLTKPNAYIEAGSFLRKIKKCLHEEGKDTEWTDYVRMLRSEHKRKIRFVEVLDKMV